MNLEDEVKRVFDRERGVLLGFLESLNLNPQSLDGAKSTLKTLSYSSQSELLTLLRNDDMREALSEAQAARKEIKRALAILELKATDPPAVEFLGQRLQVIDRQISEIQSVIKAQERYARNGR